MQSTIGLHGKEWDTGSMSAHRGPKCHLSEVHGKMWGKEYATRIIQLAGTGHILASPKRYQA